MKKLATRQLTTLAILIVLTTVAITLTQILVPVIKGYLSIGNIILIYAGLLTGKIADGIVGGLGSALTDLITGYIYYVPIALVVKGLEGFVAGFLREETSLPHLVCAIVGRLVMTVGYPLAESLTLYNFGAAILSFFLSILRSLVGSILANLLYPALRKSSIFKTFSR